ncbi:MAG: hypothetical protein EBQ96_02000 [Proteobacteria bacterium]|nr:hypothetical protein [Pseudomonadota bacterium]
MGNILAMQQPTESRLRRRAKKALAAAALGGTALINAACSSGTVVRTAEFDTGVSARPAHTQQVTGERFGGPGYPIGVLQRIDYSVQPQIRWGFNNYGYFSDGAYNVIGSREGCWMTRPAYFLDLDTGVEFKARVARPHLMDEWNCKRISGSWGVLRDGVQGIRDGIRSITPGAGDGPYYGGYYGNRGTPEPYSGGSYPRRYSW